MNVVSMRHRLNPAFAGLRAFDYSALAARMDSGLTMLGWADPFMPDACLPPHVVINEVMVSPTWNRGYVGALARKGA